MAFRLTGHGDYCGTGPGSWSEPVAAAAGNVDGAGTGADGRFAGTGPAADHHRCAGGAAWTLAVVAVAGSAGTAGMAAVVVSDTSAGSGTRRPRKGTRSHPNCKAAAAAEEESSVLEAASLLEPVTLRPQLKMITSKNSIDSRDLPFIIFRSKQN